MKDRLSEVDAIFLNCHYRRLYILSKKKKKKKKKKKNGKVTDYNNEFCRLTDKTN